MQAQTTYRRFGAAALAILLLNAALTPSCSFDAVTVAGQHPNTTRNIEGDEDDLAQRGMTLLDLGGGISISNGYIAPDGTIMSGPSPDPNCANIYRLFDGEPGDYTLPDTVNIVFPYPHKVLMIRVYGQSGHKIWMDGLLIVDTGDGTSECDLSATNCISQGLCIFWPSGRIASEVEFYIDASYTPIPTNYSYIFENHTHVNVTHNVTVYDNSSHLNITYENTTTYENHTRPTYLNETYENYTHLNITYRNDTYPTNYTNFTYYYNDTSAPQPPANTTIVYVYLPANKTDRESSTPKDYTGVIFFGLVFIILLVVQWLWVLRKDIKGRPSAKAKGKTDHVDGEVEYVPRFAPPGMNINHSMIIRERR